MSALILGKPIARRVPKPTVASRGLRRMVFYSFRSRLGWTALAADGELLCGLAFGHDDAAGAIRNVGNTLVTSPEATDRVANAPATIREIIERLKAFAVGEPVDFLDVSLCTTHLTTFGEQVTERCRQIAWGETLSYRELAAECGRPRAARAVGNAMRNNRFPLIVPCHRVLASGGGLGGYSAPQCLAMKRRLLAMEGSVGQAFLPDNS